MLPDDLTPSPAAQWAAILFITAVTLLALVGAVTIVGWLL